MTKRVANPKRRKFGKIYPGHVYGRLTVIAECEGPKPAPGRRRSYQKYYFCQCECGEASIVCGSKLTAGETRSCGCLTKDVTFKRSLRHGGNRRGRRSKAYNAWCHMRQRCYNEKNRSYPDYGGRGIRVCEKWRQSYENFLADMGEPPSPAHSIDRIDHEGNYQPGNCRWALKAVQANNTRLNRLITFNGRTQTASQWAREMGVDPDTLYYRINKGWPLEKALNAPLRRSKSRRASR